MLGNLRGLVGGITRELLDQRSLALRSLGVVTTLSLSHTHTFEHTHTHTLCLSRAVRSLGVVNSFSPLPPPPFPPIFASLELKIYLQVYMLGVRSNSVNFGAEQSPGAPN